MNAFSSFPLRNEDLWKDKLHFPEFVQKEEDLTKKILAEIILGIPKKRKKRKVTEKEL